MNCLHTAIGAHPRRCLLLLVTTSLVLSGCWNQNYSRDRWGFKPPTRPRSETPNSPDWIPSGLETKDGDQTSVEDADYHLSILPGPIAISIRKDPPQSRLVTDRATIRIDLRVGYRHGLPGLAELAAIAILELPDGPRNQPDLQTLIAGFGGNIEAEVGANWTRFTATVPSVNWQKTLRVLTDRLRQTSLTQRQFNTVQDRLIRRYLLGWADSPLLSDVSQWTRYGDLDLNALIQAIEDRNLPEISLFHQRHYQPRGVAIGLWIPNSPKDPKVLFAQALPSLKDWQPGPIPPAGQATPAPPPPAGVRWTEGPGQQSEISLILPLSPATPETLTLMECLSMGGIGGRLGAQFEERIGQEPVLERREVGHYGQRYTLLTGTVPTDKVVALWNAAQAAWSSLASKPPIGEELLASARRARLRLLRRQDHPDSWFEAMGVGLMRRQTGGPVRDLARVDNITMQAAASAARQHVARSIAMVVSGGSIPKDAGPEFQKTSITIPDYNPTSTTQTPQASAKTQHFLNLAIQALGDRKQFGAFKGYRSVETWRDQEGLTA
ncbi:MAG: hypothetical protein VX951_13945, partial [Planctomycetota bacterium]|nr:hypothetical protein [Planctomycetota bacterium]